MRFNENIIKLRENRQLNIASAARLLGQHMSVLFRWEKGDAYPNVFALVALARFYDVEIDGLLLEEKEELQVTSMKAHIDVSGLPFHEKIVAMRFSLGLTQKRLQSICTYHRKH